MARAWGERNQAELAATEPRIRALSSPRAPRQRVAHACRIHSDLMSPINHIVPTVAELLEFRREERARQAQGWGRTAGLGGG